MTSADPARQCASGYCDCWQTPGPYPTNCHSHVLSVGGNVGYVQSVDGIGGVSGGNVSSVLTTLNCIRTFPMLSSGGNGSGDGLPTNIGRFSLRQSLSPALNTPKSM